MVRGCGRGKGLSPLGWLWRNPARLLGSRRPLIPFPHQRVGFPPPLPHHHQQTENQQLLQFPWQQISLRFSPSSSQRRECVHASAHTCVYIRTNVLGGMRLGKKPSRDEGERSKEASRTEGKPSCPVRSPRRAAFKGHLLYARCCTRHLISYQLMPASVLHLQLAPNK